MSDEEMRKALEGCMNEIHSYLQRNSERLTVAWREADRRYREVSPAAPDDAGLRAELKGRQSALHEANKILGAFRTVARHWGIQLSQGGER